MLAVEHHAPVNCCEDLPNPLGAGSERLRTTGLLALNSGGHDGIRTRLRSLDRGVTSSGPRIHAETLKVPILGNDPSHPPV